MINHANNFHTNVTSDQLAGVTTTPIDAIPGIDPPYYLALDATNINSHYEIIYVSSDTATNVNHAATTYAHSTDEEVRLVVPSVELDAIWAQISTGWLPIPTGTTLAYSSADDPTYVVTTSTDLRAYIQVGDRVKFTNNSTTFYGIVTAIAAGTMTLYGGTDYDVANSAITAVYFSHVKSPVGFPMDPAKWTVTTTDTNTTTQSSPVQNTWYNIQSIAHTIPIGVWRTRYSVNVGPLYNSNTSVNQFTTLSTANNSESDTDFTVFGYIAGASGNLRFNAQHEREKTLVLAAKTTYYLNHKTDNSTQTQLNIYGGTAKTIIRSICAYL